MNDSTSTANGPALRGRAVILFINFMFVILAYYQVKVASRSLLLEYGGAAAFPYVWIGSALLLLAFIGIYTRLVAQHSRVRVIVGSLLSFALVLGHEQRRLTFAAASGS